MKCQEIDGCPNRAEMLLWSVNGSRLVCFNHWIMATESYRDQLRDITEFTQQDLDWFENYRG